MPAVLDQHARLGPEAIETLTPDEARERPTPCDAVMAPLVAQQRDTAPTALVPGVTSVDRSIPGAAGSMPARIDTRAGAEPFPVIVYHHGGGWVIANKEVHDDGAQLEQAPRSAGNAVERRVFDNVTHEFSGMAAVPDPRDRQRLLSRLVKLCIDVYYQRD